MDSCWVILIGFIVGIFIGCMIADAIGSGDY